MGLGQVTQLDGAFGVGRTGELRLAGELLQQCQRLRLQGIELQGIGAVGQGRGEPFAWASGRRTLAARAAGRQRGAGGR